MTSTSESACDIAIVGMACRFPGASSLDEFWDKLSKGAELITFLSDDEIMAEGVDPRLLGDPLYVKADGTLDGIELFDAAFFGYTPREAELMDPQLRHFLEVAWEALENAGYSWDSNSSRVGVYAGASLNSYLFNNLYPNSKLINSVGSFQTTILNNRDYLPLHVSYKFNLNGPSMNVQTACSTSLTAVHLACQSLLGRESDLALAGGSSIRVPQRRGYLFEEGGILSPDGHCRAFDEKAAGTIASSGVAAVVLKRLDDAVANRDFIHAVIKGTAVNNDGAIKAGFTAPAIEGQAAVIEEALAMAMVSPATVTYIETHGTATPLGDPIEIAALTQAFRRYTNAAQFCRIGSVKTNLGHLDAAAGAAGLIKTALALQHRKIPPSLHFEKPNPRIDFDNSPFLVNTSLHDWNTAGYPRRAGVSSFGIGGTNVHAVLEEAPARESGSVDPRSKILVLSARTSAALDAATRNVAGFISSHSSTDLSDVAYTLQTGRKHMAHRRAVVCGSATGSAAEALELLNKLPPERVFDGFYDKGNRPVAFVFPGQGSQYAAMGRGIYDAESVFRSEIDRCLALLDSTAAADLRSVLFPEPSDSEQAGATLQHTALAQPALFAVSYSVARQLMKWGIQPDSMIGHSVGEFVAACLSGVMELEYALSLVALRGKLMGKLPAGSMLAVSLDEQETALAVKDLPELSIAAVNGPRLSIVSGSSNSITKLEESLSLRGVSSKPLRVSHSFHSEMMDSILGEFTSAVARVRLSAPRVPYISNVTGTWITSGQATSPEYYARHLRETVRFYQGVGELMTEPDRVFVEVGPGGSLKAALGTEIGRSESRPIIETLRRPSAVAEDEMVLKAALANLWVCGVDVNWESVHEGEVRNRVPLPTYPFERNRYWIEASENNTEASEKFEGKQSDISKWFYHQSWRRSPLPSKSDTRAPDEARSALLFVDGMEVCEGAAHILESGGIDCVIVRSGEAFEKSSDTEYAISPMDRASYLTLLKAVRASGKTPSLILHCWNESLISVSDRTEEPESIPPLGYCSLLYLAQAIGELGETVPIEILAITNQAQDVIGNETVNPAAAVGLGPCKVIPLEYPNVTCRSIDVMATERAAESRASSTERLAFDLAAEAMSGSRDRMVAFRNGLRWTAEIDTLTIDLNTAAAPVIRPEAAYLITGGMGEIEFEIAKHLAELGAVKLIITGMPLPPGASWNDYKVEAAQESQIPIIERLTELTRLGVDLLADTTEAGNYEGMKAVIELARRRFGSVKGVIHTAFAAAGGMIQLKSPEAGKPVLAPKIAGTIAINEIFKDDPLDFLILFSTTLSITGVFGQTDYCAANAYLDAFASYSRTRDESRVVSINWDVTSWERWQESAMISALELQSQIRELRERFGITPREAVRCLDVALALDRSQVIVSSRNFLQVLKSQDELAANGFLDQIASIGRSMPGHASSDSSAAYVAPAGEAEEAIAFIWRDIFGIKQIGINDDFFGIGGNSLIAIQVISRLRKEFDIDLPMSALFEHTTISSLAAVIRSIRSEGRSDDEEILEMEQLLAEIENLTPEEIKAALAEETAERKG